MGDDILSFMENEETPTSSQSWTYTRGPSDLQSDLERRNIAEMNRNLRDIYTEEGLDYPAKDLPFSRGLQDKRKVALHITVERVKLALLRIKEAKNVDLCFLLDGTASMASWIKSVKQCISSVCGYLLLKKANHAVVNRLRLALIIYRDFADKDRQFLVIPFSESVSDFKLQLDKVVASGGGDDAEDVFGGLEKVAHLNWDKEAGTRVLFHITDSPCHGKEFHEGVSDNHPDGDPKNRDISCLLERLKELEIRYFFGKIHTSTDKMIEKFSAAQGEPITVFDLTEDAMDEVIKKLVENSVLSSTVKSVCNAKSKEAKKFTIERKLPNWTNVAQVVGTYMSYKLPLSLRDVIDSVPFDRSVEKDVKVQIAQNPFDNGAMRLAYFGVAIGKAGSTDIVVKENLYRERSEPRVVYETYLAMQTVAAYLAKEFEEELKRRDVVTRSKIKYINAKLLVVRKASSELKYYMCEPLLHAPVSRYLSKQISDLATSSPTTSSEGNRHATATSGLASHVKRQSSNLSLNKAEVVKLLSNDVSSYLPSFVRFTNNADYIASPEKIQSQLTEAGCDEKQLELLLAFSHWTYKYSRGQLMVVDLQGVLTVDEATGKPLLMLTDPAIHCADTSRFRPSNLGEDGMKLFLSRHKCNEFCKSLNLKPENDDTDYD